MGAGSGSGAGVAPAGANPVDPSRPRVRGSSALVPFFNIGSRTFPRDPATGKILLVHWVDQAVALAMGVTAGTLKSQPGLGNTIRLIKRAAGPTLQNQVEDACRVALSKLVERRDIGVTGLFVSTAKRSQIIVVLSYINLRTMPNVPNDMRFIF